MLMRHFLLSVFLSIMILLSACKKDSQQITQPEENNNTEFILQSTKTIGNSGGTIQTQDVEIVIPEGAFTYDHVIKFSKRTIQSYLGLTTASVFFRLEGLDRYYNFPIQIKIKITSGTTSSKVMLVTEDAFIKSLNKIDKGSFPINGTESGGYFICELPALGGRRLSVQKSGSDDEATIDFGLVLITSKSSTTGKFKIQYPAKIAEVQVNNLLSYLDEAYTTINSLGFDISSKRTKWPVEVILVELADDVDGYSVNSIWGDNYGYILINMNKINDVEAMRVTTGHEFFHIVQSLYDFRAAYFKAKFSSDHYWIDEATSTWSEELFTDEQNYIPNNRDGFETAPLKGMLSGGSANPREHGYGLSSFIKFLSERCGQSYTSLLYKNIYNLDNIYYAFEKAANSTLPDLWLDYLKELILGNIYEDNINTYINSEMTTKFRIKTEADSVAEFNSIYLNFSGKLYNITLERSFSEDESLELKLVQGNDYGKIMVFKYKSASIELISSVSNKLTIKDIKTLQESGYNILVLVADNHYSPSGLNDEITIHMKITKEVKINLADFKYATFNLAANGTKNCTGQDPSFGSIYINIGNKQAGSWSGNSFTATWDTSDGVNDYQGYITATVSDDGVLISFSGYEKRTDHATPLYPVIDEYSLSGTGAKMILVQTGNKLKLYNEIIGESAFGYISSNSWSSSIPSLNKLCTGTATGCDSGGGFQFSFRTYLQ